MQWSLNTHRKAEGILFSVTSYINATVKTFGPNRVFNWDYRVLYPKQQELFIIPEFENSESHMTQAKYSPLL